MLACAVACCDRKAVMVVRFVNVDTAYPYCADHGYRRDRRDRIIGYRWKPQRIRNIQEINKGNQ